MKRTVNSKKKIGDLGERRATRYLRLRGYFIRERNWRAGKAEIDIIAETLREIVFVEVKTRTYRKEELLTAAPPGVAVNTNKQRLTRQAARQYIYQCHTKKQPRMDVIEVWLCKDNKSGSPRVEKIHHIKAAY